MEYFKEYPHLHVSKSKSSFSTNLFGRFILMTPVESKLYKQHTGCAVSKSEPFADV